MTINTIVPIILFAISIVLGVIGFFVQRSIFMEIDRLKETKLDASLCQLKEKYIGDQINELKILTEKIDVKLDDLIVRVARMNGMPH